MREYTAIVLAGGVGSRLRPLTTHRPKPLVPVANWTMLDYNLFLLKNAGVKKIVIVVRYLGEQIREYINEKIKGDPRFSTMEPGYSWASPSPLRPPATTR